MSAKYVVISYDDDEQRYYDDTVTAEDSEQASQPLPEEVQE